MPAKKHAVGDGLHYITDYPVVFPEGTFQAGESSECCVLFTVQLICSALRFPDLWILWSSTYPEDPMSAEDTAYICSQAEPHTVPFSPDAESLDLIIQDLGAIGYPELAEQLNYLSLCTFHRH